MRIFIGVIAVFLVAVVPFPAASQEQKEVKSALETHPDGWVDLTADGLKLWKRNSIPPNSKLKKGNPWSFDDKTGTIICNGVGYHEMLHYYKPFGDGIFHVEWRFKKIEGKRGYNSGVYVRNSASGDIWHQAQVGSQNVGHFFGATPVDGKIKRFRSDKFKGPQRGKEAGEWNTYEITMKGKTLTLWVNGAITTIWEDCAVPEGYIGMEAEGWYIEFRNVKYRPLKDS